MSIRTRILRPFVIAGLSVTMAWTGLAFVAPAPAKAAEPASFEVSSYLTKANAIISLGNRYLGTPYKYGSRAGVTSTFDCSSFTQYVYGKNGVSLRRASIDQSKQGTFVSRSNIRKGDLLFFSTSKSNGKIAHVGIYTGNGQILHTYGEGGVKYSSLNSNWWSSHYITARRVL